MATKGGCGWFLPGLHGVSGKAFEGPNALEMNGISSSD
jgi:hypothetical protein